MQNPAIVRDLESRWHPNPLKGDEAMIEVAYTRLDEAWRALQDELPDLVARIEAGQQAIDRVVDVVCAAALRVLRNPEGYVKGSASIDDTSETWERDSTTLSNDLYFTAAELRRLTPTLKSPGAFTITPSPV